MKILQNHYTFTHFVTKLRQYQWKVYSFLASLLCVPSGCAHTIARPKFKSRMQFAKQLLFGALCHRRKNWRHTKVHASLALRKIDSSVVVRSWPYSETDSMTPSKLVRTEEASLQRCSWRYGLSMAANWVWPPWLRGSQVETKYFVPVKKYIL